MPTPLETHDDTVGGIGFTATNAGSPGVSHRCRPVRESDSQGAQRAVDPLLSLSQKGGCGDRQGGGAFDEEGESGGEAIRRVRILPPPAPNGLWRRQTSRKQSLYGLWLRTFDDGGAEGSYERGGRGKEAMEPPLDGAAGTGDAEGTKSLVVGVESAPRQKPRTQLQ